jgi:hypothetical protein
VVDRCLEGCPHLRFTVRDARSARG